MTVRDVMLLQGSYQALIPVEVKYCRIACENGDGFFPVGTEKQNIKMLGKGLDSAYAGDSS